MSDHARQRGFSLRSFISFLVRRHNDKRSTRALLELPDNVLDDIGLSRWDVSNALNSGWNRMPSKKLSATAAENRAMILAANEAMRASLSVTPARSGEERLAA